MYKYYPHSTNFNILIFTFSSCCGAGTAADTEMTCNMISSQLELHRMSTDRKVPVIAAVQLLKQYLFRYAIVLCTKYSKINIKFYLSTQLIPEDILYSVKFCVMFVSLNFV